MNNYKIIKSLPNEQTHSFFEKFPEEIYSSSSQRFKLGNDPILKHLEGCYTLFKNRTAVGRFSLYENPKLNYKGEKAATIGSYECIDDQQVSEYLLNHAANIIRTKGYAWLIGPMEGSTWNNHRFSNFNDFPNFFLEPYHHEYYNRQFLNAGFQNIAEYTSTLFEFIELNSIKVEQFEKQYSKQGAVFRKLKKDDFKNELKKIASLCLEGFSNNFLYSPITVNDFILKYEKLKDFIDPEFVWIIEDKTGDIQAFVFCINDFFDVSNSTLVLKSLVRKKTSPFKSVAGYLMAKITGIAINRGYSKIIHAFMHSDNASLKISKSLNGVHYKNYSLYGQKL